MQVCHKATYRSIATTYSNAYVCSDAFYLQSGIANLSEKKILSIG